MKNSMPEIIAMQSLIIALSAYLESTMQTYSDQNDDRLDELKILLCHLPNFLEACREQVDYKIREENSAEKMIARMHHLAAYYQDLLKAVDHNSGTRMQIELLRASFQEV